VIAIDRAYTYALVLGSNKEYLWFLSRKKIIPDSVKQEYLKKAQDYGCNIAQLVWVEQDKE
jgi:apolipoprotein D and lipocalin family protein